MAKLNAERPLKLVLFDMDGTLVDSLAHIRRAMAHAFESQGLPEPSEVATRAIIGLSLPVAMSHLRPDLDGRQIEALVEAYKGSFAQIREMGQDEQASPLFSGALDVIDTLGGDDQTLLGIATGKSRRGLTHVLDLHDLSAKFVTTQVADDHPSKPHPSMIHTALNETGVEPENAIIVGDTTYDLEMGRAAGIKTVAVSWGYHPTEHLRPFADALIDSFNELPREVTRLIGANG